MAHIVSTSIFAFILSLTLLFEWTTAESSFNFCLWTKVRPGGETHHAFLSRAPYSSHPWSVRLYQSARGGDGDLLRCAWSDDTAVIQNYFNLCRERETRHQFSDNVSDSKIFSFLDNADDDVCVPMKNVSDSLGLSGDGGGGGDEHVRDRKRRARSLQDGQSSEVKKRVKRGFIVPGTLWCGSGNKAPSYSDLGVFSDTDGCCREHDQCKDTILSFHTQFGVFNGNIFTMSHCDCDNRFRRCLMASNDSIAHVVGYTFFNLLKMHCFQFSHRLQCTERNWFGMCKETKLALFADVHPPEMFSPENTTEISSNSTSFSGINSTISAEILNSTTTAPVASTSPVTVIDTVSNKNISVEPSTTGTKHTDSQQNKIPTMNRTLPALDHDVTEMQFSCDVFRDVDECSMKVLPHRRRYGLLNTQPSTLYHCNCTDRLFQSLSKQRHLNKIQNFLMRRISSSCFTTPGCTRGKICLGVLVEEPSPRLVQNNSSMNISSSTKPAVDEKRPLQASKLNYNTDVDAQSPIQADIMNYRRDVDRQRPLQADTVDYRRPNPMRTKRKGRLYKLCLKKLSKVSNSKTTAKLNLDRLAE